uniref:Uncharacterized protein n=1 Tax=Arundo donax TaxID=35708 RepID=A0A0A9FI69_ARUDO
MAFHRTPWRHGELIMVVCCITQG